MALLRDRNFRLLFAGQAISRLGDGLYTAAVAWLAWSLTHPPGAVAGVTVAAATIDQVGVRSASMLSGAALIAIAATAAVTLTRVSAGSARRRGSASPLPDSNRGTLPYHGGPLHARAPMPEPKSLHL